jgi:alpha-L-fucosidase 2
MSNSRIITPATDWRDALPVGNGTLGAMIFGGIAHERILFNHELLYSNVATPPLPDISSGLPSLRALLAAERWEEANGYYARAWQDAGYQAQTAVFLPGPMLHVRQLVGAGEFHDYERGLDYRSGVATVKWRTARQRWSRSLAVPRDSSRAVFQMLVDEGSFDLEIWLAPQSLREHTDDEGIPLPLSCRTHEELANQTFLLAVTALLGAGYQATATLQTDGQVSLGRGRWQVHGARRLAIEVELTVDAERKPTPKPPGPAVPAHAELFDRCRLTLDSPDHSLSNDELLIRAYQGDVSNALFSRMIDSGRHLLMASGAGGRLPPNLQGIWNGSYSPPWSSAFFFNENLQMTLWPALPSGLPECVTPVFDLLESHLEAFRTNARRLFGCRGILPPLFMTPDSGQKKNPQAHVLYWTGSGAWLAHIYYDYWLFTRDREFLQNRALPFMREVAAFYEDFLVSGADGWLHVSPSNSPENHPLGHVTADGRTLRVCTDATMDFALVRELLGHLLDAHAILDRCDEPALARWREMLDRLPPYRLNEDGALAEWIDPRLQDNYHHRHLSHVYPAFPGWEITSLNHPELMEACRIAVEKRMAIGLEDQTSWSLAHMASLFARFGRGNEALHCLELLARSTLRVNLLTDHNDLRDMGITMSIRKGGAGAMQIDAAIGATAAAFEMLGSLLPPPPGKPERPSQLRLLPALPTRWNRGQLTGLRLRGGHRLDLSWDTVANTWEARLRVGHDTEVMLTHPGFLRDMPSATTNPRPTAGHGHPLRLCAGEHRVFCGHFTKPVATAAQSS